MAKPLRVLIVEDSEDDVLLILRALRRGGYVLTIERVDTATDFAAALSRQTWDVVVADYSLPTFDGLSALRVLRTSSYDLPFILVSGTIGEELAVEAMKAGANDYVMKDNLARLLPAVERELHEAETRVARKKAEEALRESEERFRRMADSIHDGLTIIEGGKVVYVNDRMCRITGYSREELRGMTGSEYAAPEERERLLQVMADARRQGIFPTQLQFWIVRKDGTRRCIDNRYTTRSRADGFTDRYVVTRDITEQKQAEREIAERRLYLERVLAAAPDAIVTLDAEHRVVEWNRGAEKLFGYSRAQAIGQRLDHLLCGPQGSDETEPLAGMVLGGVEVAPVEIVRYRQDASAVDVIASGSPIMVDDELIGAVAIYTDISKRKRAERLLQALNEAALAVEQALTLAEIFDTVGQEFDKLGFRCAILVLDKTQNLLSPVFFSHNPEQVRLATEALDVEDLSFSIPVERTGAIGQIVHERRTVYLAGPDDISRALPYARHATIDGLARILGIDKAIGAPLIVGDEVIGLLAVQSGDLTEEDAPAITAFAHQMAAAWRKAHLLNDLENSLKQLRQTQAQFLQAQKMEAVGRLAGGVAHDFNNALTIIHLSTQLLKRQMHAEDPFREYVDQIEEAGRRATSLTKQLLSFSRREIIEPRVVNLSQLVADLSEMLRRLIGEDIDLVCSLADDLWSVWSDPTQLDQIIINLAINARDAMPDGGSLSITTANRVLEEVDIVDQVDVAPGDYVALSVRDTGVGMDTEVKAHLFEPFFTTKEPGKGTGLGLATVYGIARQNGGHVWVDSEVERGTTLTIVLPRTTRVEPVAIPRTAPTSLADGSETVLVVEDDPVVRRMARQILRTSGYQVLLASSGPGALEISAQHQGTIDLLLTDVVLPQMNGRDLAERLRTERPGLRTVYMSGYSDDAVAQHGVSHQGTLFLAKPFTVETLTYKVRMALDAPL